MRIDTMTIHKTAELTGKHLDAAVAKAEGGEWQVEADGIYAPGAFCYFEPSTRWSQGGPIIEREGFDLEHHAELVLGEPQTWWEAYKRLDCGQHCYTGPTPLIAAMRAYVAGKFGETVEL